MSKDLNTQIQDKLNEFYDIVNDEKYQDGDVDNATLNKLRVIKEKLAGLYNKKSKDEDLHSNDKANILALQHKELEFYKNNHVELSDISKLFCDSLDMKILVDDDFLILNIANISDEIFDRYEPLISNPALLKIAVKKFPDNKNFKTILEHLTSSENA